MGEMDAMRLNWILTDDPIAGEVYFLRMPPRDPMPEGPREICCGVIDLPVEAEKDGLKICEAVAEAFLSNAPYNIRCYIKEKLLGRAVG